MMLGNQTFPPNLCHHVSYISAPSGQKLADPFRSINLGAIRVQPLKNDTERLYYMH